MIQSIHVLRVKSCILSLSREKIYCNYVHFDAFFLLFCTIRLTTGARRNCTLISKIPLNGNLRIPLHSYDLHWHILTNIFLYIMILEVQCAVTFLLTLWLMILKCLERAWYYRQSTTLQYRPSHTYLLTAYKFIRLSGIFNVMKFRNF